MEIKVWGLIWGSSHLEQEEKQGDCLQGSHLHRLLDLFGTSGAKILSGSFGEGQTRTPLKHRCDQLRDKRTPPLKTHVNHSTFKKNRTFPPYRSAEVVLGNSV